MYNPRIQRRINLELIYDTRILDGVSSLCFGSNDDLIAIASDETTVISHIYNKAFVAELSDPGPIRDLQFSSCGKYLAFCPSWGLIGVRCAPLCVSTDRLTCILDMGYCDGVCLEMLQRY